MMIQWPDKFYHTSADSIDKVSPHSLSKVATIAATYSYFLANAGELEAPWIVSQVISREKRNIIRLIQETLDKAASSEMNPYEIEKHRNWLKNKLEYKTSIAVEAIKSIKRIAPNINDTINTMISELKIFADVEYDHATKALNNLATKQEITKLPDDIPAKKAVPHGVEKIPKKLYRGPLSSRPWISKLCKEDKEGYRAMNKRHGITYGGPATLALYWTDGSRSLSEISRLVELESGSTNLPYLVEYYEYLRKMGLVKFVDR